MTWSELKFSKHKGKTLPQVVLSDPDWFFWAIETKIFEGTIAREAECIAKKAKRIKIPKQDPENWRVEYVIGFDGKFAHFSIVEADRPVHQGSSSTVRSDWLDLSFIRRLTNYDKLGYRLMMRDFKYYYFGSKEKRLTKKLCEEFFDDNSRLL